MKVFAWPESRGQEIRAWGQLCQLQWPSWLSSSPCLPWLQHSSLGGWRNGPPCPQGWLTINLYRSVCTVWNTPTCSSADWLAEDQIVVTSPKWGSHLYPHFWYPKWVQEGQRLGTSSPRTKVSKGALPGNTLREQGLQGWAWHFPLELSLEAFWRQTGQGNVLDVPAAKGPPVEEPERDEQWRPQSACETGPWASQHGPRELLPRHHHWNALTSKQEWVGTEKQNTKRRLAALTGHLLPVLLLETSPEWPGIQRREPPQIGHPH